MLDFKSCIWKNLIPLLLYNLYFLYTVGIINCWVGTNSFPTNKNDDRSRPQVSSVWNTGSSQPAINELVFLVATAQREIHVNTHSSVKSKYTGLVLFRGKDISSSICLLELSSFFLPLRQFSPAQDKGRKGEGNFVFWRTPHYWDLFHMYTYYIGLYIVYVFTDTVHNMYGGTTHTHVNMQSFHTLSSYLCLHTT